MSDIYKAVTSTLPGFAKQSAGHYHEWPSFRGTLVRSGTGNTPFQERNLSISPSQVSRNGLLASLDPAILARLLPRLAPVAFENRRVFHAENGPIDFIYFPLSGIVSMVATLADGMQAEVGIIGREGMVGLTAISGNATSFVEAMAQNPGEALRISAREFRQEFEDLPPLRNLVLRYYESFMAQVMQTAACNGRHELEQRLARWLLMCHDRQDGDVLPLTQEFIAMMLGVHRPSITVAAGILHRAGLIRYAGGRITIVDRDRLEAAACECYHAMRRRSETLLPRHPGPAAARPAAAPRPEVSAAGAVGPACPG